MKTVLVDFVGRHNKIIKIHRLICRWRPADIVAAKKCIEVEKINPDSVGFAVLHIV